MRALLLRRYLVSAAAAGVCHCWAPKAPRRACASLVSAGASEEADVGVLAASASVDDAALRPSSGPRSLSGHPAFVLQLRALEAEEIASFTTEAQWYAAASTITCYLRAVLGDRSVEGSVPASHIAKLLGVITERAAARAPGLSIDTLVLLLHLRWPRAFERQLALVAEQLLNMINEEVCERFGRDRQGGMAVVDEAPPVGVSAVAAPLSPEDVGEQLIDACLGSGGSVHQPSRNEANTASSDDAHHRVSNRSRLGHRSGSGGTALTYFDPRAVRFATSADATRLVDRLALVMAAVSRHLPRERFARCIALRLLAHKSRHLSDVGVAELSRLVRSVATLANNDVFWELISPRIMKAFSDARQNFSKDGECRRVARESRRAASATSSSPELAFSSSSSSSSPLSSRGSAGTHAVVTRPVEFSVLNRFVMAFEKALPPTAVQVASISGAGSRTLLVEAMRRVDEWPTLFSPRPAAYSDELQHRTRSTLTLSAENVAQLLATNLRFPAFPVAMSTNFIEQFVQPFIHTCKRGDIHLALAVVRHSKMESEVVLNACLSRSIRLSADPETLLLMIGSIKQLSGNVDMCFTAKSVGRFFREFFDLWDRHFTFLLPKQQLELASAIPVFVAHFGPDAPVSRKLMTLLDRIAATFAALLEDGVLDFGSAEALLDHGRAVGASLSPTASIARAPRLRDEQQRQRPPGSKGTAALLSFAPSLLQLGKVVQAKLSPASKTLAKDPMRMQKMLEECGPGSLFVKQNVHRLWQLLEEVNQSVFLFEQKKISANTRHHIFKLIDSMNVYDVLCALSLMRKEAVAVVRSQQQQQQQQRAPPPSVPPGEGTRHHSSFTAVNDQLAADAKAVADATKAFESLIHEHPRLHLTEELQEAVAHCIEDRLRRLKRAPHQRRSLLLGSSKFATPQRLAHLIGLLSTSPMRRLRYSPQLLEELLHLSEDMGATEQVDVLTAMLVESGHSSISL